MNGRRYFGDFEDVRLEEPASSFSVWNMKGITIREQAFNPIELNTSQSLSVFMQDVNRPERMGKELLSE